MSSTPSTVSTEASQLLTDLNETKSSGLERLREFMTFVINNPEGGDPDKDFEYQRLYQQVQESINALKCFSSKGRNFLIDK